MYPATRESARPGSCPPQPPLTRHAPTELAPRPEHGAPYLSHTESLGVFWISPPHRTNESPSRQVYILDISQLSPPPPPPASPCFTLTSPPEDGIKPPTSPPDSPDCCKSGQLTSTPKPFERFSSSSGYNLGSSAWSPRLPRTRAQFHLLPLPIHLRDLGSSFTGIFHLDSSLDELPPIFQDSTELLT